MSDKAKQSKFSFPMHDHSPAMFWRGNSSLENEHFHNGAIIFLFLESYNLPCTKVKPYCGVKCTWFWSEGEYLFVSEEKSLKKIRLALSGKNNNVHSDCHMWVYFSELLFLASNYFYLIPFLFHAVLPLSVQMLINGICTTIYIYTSNLPGGAVKTSWVSFLQ